MFLRLSGCPNKATKGWNEMKVHFVIFCNCAQFLMKAAKVHCCSQHNEMAAWMWKFMMKIKSLTSTFLTLPSFYFPLTLFVGIPFLIPSMYQIPKIVEVNIKIYVCHSLLLLPFFVLFRTPASRKKIIIKKSSCTRRGMG